MAIIDTLPTPPTRTDPTNFDTRADAFLTALVTFSTQANNAAGTIDTQYNSVLSNTGIASSSATIAQASANFKGAWSSLTGAVSRPASVSHNNKFWALLPASLANITLSQPGVTADWIEITVGISYYDYNSRATLRTITGNLLIVENLGLFRYTAGSTEIDDDETCFTTTGGAWILISPSTDFVFALIDSLGHNIVEAVNDKLKDVPKVTTFDWINSTGGAINAESTLTIVVRHDDAKVGCQILVEPYMSGLIGNYIADRARVVCHGYCQTDGEIIITIRNTTSSVVGTIVILETKTFYKITIFKKG